MRKRQKEQINHFLRLLKKTQKVIEMKFMELSIPSIMDLLEECQNGVICVGNMIEISEGGDSISIPLIEEYCKQLYETYESLPRTNIVNIKKMIANMQMLLDKIVESVSNNITIRKEVVFLPYNATMWDSLESVWKEMSQNSSYDVYVVPIPYYEKNSDGSFGTLHYEGDLYPKYVQTVYYEDYDLEERHPDIIFIHNPYDQYNRITSVHPDYYSQRIKNYTDKLIYIPYFILDEIDIADKARWSSIKHFAQTVGVINADMVIVQSEKMRQCYIEALVEMMGQHTREKWEKNIWGIGSPKLDKVSIKIKENTNIPKQWMKAIKKADGSLKKVILYNTSVNAFLQHDENMLQKIQDVLMTFKKVHNEIVLLWRPHPLMKSTILSMRPCLWNKYEKIVKQYKNEAWGIYDDSAELERAIAFSDAYYGDYSSVVQLCHKAGIPVMIQDPRLINRCIVREC
uniref:hypothetical protein n=1 Tax=Agathobacter sp. TaxID=2021311 RepID=UPI004056932C